MNRFLLRKTCDKPEPEHFLKILECCEIAERSGYSTWIDCESGEFYMLLLLTSPSRYVRVLKCAPMSDVEVVCALTSNHPEVLTAQQDVLKLLGVPVANEEGNPF